MECLENIALLKQDKKREEKEQKLMANDQKTIEQKIGSAEKQLRLLLSRIDKVLLDSPSSTLPFKETIVWLRKLAPQSTATLALATTFAELHSKLAIPTALLKKNFVKNLFDGLQTLQRFDQWFEGGLSGYIETANSLIKTAKNQKSANTDNYGIQKSYSYSMPPLCDLRSATFEKRKRLFENAMALLETTAIVLVAGGIGERLGYGESKLKIPLEPMSGASFMQHFADAHYSLRKLAAITKVMAKKKTSQRDFSNKGFQLSREISAEIAKVKLPFVIVASHANIESTQKFLDENDYFGIPPDDVRILQQPSLPCLVDDRGALAFDDEGSLVCKPGGHGSVHRLLLDSGALDWFSQCQVSHVVFLQDTNAQVLRSLPLLLGLSEDFQVVDSTESTATDFLLVGVPQVKNQPMGVLATRKIDQEAENLVEKGFSSISNVEYHLLQTEAKKFSGDIKQYPANTNTIVVRFTAYKDIVDKFGHLLPYQFNPKFSTSVDNSTATFQQFSSPARLEQLMQDLSLLYENPHAVAIALLDRCDAFAAVKTLVLNGFTNTNAEGSLNADSRKRTNRSKIVSNNLFSTSSTEFQLNDPLNAFECELKYFSSVKQCLQIYGNQFPEVETETEQKKLLSSMEKMTIETREIVLKFFSWKSYRSFARVVLPQHCLMDEVALRALCGNFFSPYAALVVQGRGELSLQGMIMDPFSALTISLGEGVQLVCENVRVSGIGYRLQMTEDLSAQLEKQTETKAISKAISFGKEQNIEDNRASISGKSFSKLETLRGYRIIRLAWQRIQLKTPGRYRLFDKKGKVFVLPCT